jgi:hypothetical protein
MSGIMLSVIGAGNLPAPASLVGTLALSAGATANPAAVGAVSGDLAIASTTGSVASGSGNGWTAVPGTSSPLYYKELEAGDTSAPITMSAGGSRGGVVIYHGARSVVRVAAGSYDHPDSGVTFAGYVRNAAHAGMFGRGRFSLDGGGSLSVDGVASFVGRLNFTDTTRDNVLTDWLAADRPDYVDGAQFAASLGGSDFPPFTAVAEIFELRTTA